ncbi:hypothetical protein HZ326_28054 [Fusarium oxysporum f. sp. albedinis]|nr:hypothetical protein HZ326_28054 [Fusarium oxysporum f. sp. albedinis]
MCCSEWLCCFPFRRVKAVGYHSSYCCNKGCVKFDQIQQIWPVDEARYAPEIWATTWCLGWTSPHMLGSAACNVFFGSAMQLSGSVPGRHGECGGTWDNTGRRLHYNYKLSPKLRIDQIASIPQGGHEARARDHLAQTTNTKRSILYAGCAYVKP